jgi:hypothetical protein
MSLFVKRCLAIAVVVAVCTPSPAAALSHARSMKTYAAFAGVSAGMSTTGMPLTGPVDFNEMSLTLYAPMEYANGSLTAPTFALGIGRNNGYDSTPAHQIHDGTLRAYTLSTYAVGDVENNHEFVYLGGRTSPTEIFPGKMYYATIVYTGERRWIYYADAAHPLRRGYSARWGDRKGHFAYRWVAKLNGVQIADCWFNSPVARIKYENNHVRPERV